LIHSLPPFLSPSDNPDVPPPPPPTSPQLFPSPVQSGSIPCRRSYFYYGGFFLCGKSGHPCFLVRAPMSLRVPYSRSPPSSLLLFFTPSFGERNAALPRPSFYLSPFFVFHIPSRLGRQLIPPFFVFFRRRGGFPC